VYREAATDRRGWTVILPQGDDKGKAARTRRGVRKKTLALPLHWLLTAIRGLAASVEAEEDRADEYSRQ
jgi:hypothetical protein